MKYRFSILLLGSLTCAAAGVQAETAQDLQQLKQQLAEIQKNYQAQIQLLESRIEQLESQQMQAQPASASVAAQSRPNAFNPAISLILNGRYQSFSHDRGDDIPGFSTAGEAGYGSQGFSLGESELNLQSNIDDLFFGNLTMSLADEDGETSVELEEAWIQTLAMPADLTLKAGRFFSGVAYMNERHSHTDDFADRPLPYRAMLNGRYLDDGMQLRWLAPTDTFLELGGEILRGAQFPAGGSAHQGVGSWSLFAHAGGDVGMSNSWLAGLSYLSVEARKRESGDKDNPDLFTGNSDLVIADLVWKWAPNGNAYRHNAILQGGLFWRDESGRFAPSGLDWLPYSGNQFGWYAQAVYQFMPNWRIGIRGSGLNADNPDAAFAGTSLDTQGHDPRDVSLMVDWSHSEFSRLRLQYTRDETQSLSDDRFILQYIVSLGAHGAHQF
ncbi:FlxA-like family protein [Thiolapillus sp.]